MGDIKLDIVVLLESSEYKFRKTTHIFVIPKILAPYRLRFRMYS